MWIDRLEIKNFRNYDEQIVNFNPNINIFYGENAQGKTNIIESIFLGSLGKSFRTNKEKELIKFDKDSCKVKIHYLTSDRDGEIEIKIGKKKNILINNIQIDRISKLLGNIHVVIFTPDDINILKGSPQNRRNFLNIMISQLRPRYMHIYSMYKKAQDERNNYLKKIKLENANEELLEIWDEQLAEYGTIIYKYRLEFIEKLKEKIFTIHHKITEKREEIDIRYVSDNKNKNEYLKILKEKRENDIQKGYTTRGVHIDDFNVYINKRPVNIYGSQGQHRTAMLSLKLSELKVIYDEIGENPILLLDDFMSELDQKRIKNFLENIQDTQVIITCTEKMKFENLKNNIFEVVNGKVKIDQN